MNSRRFVVLPAAVALVAAGVWLGVARAGGHGMNIKAEKGVQWAASTRTGRPSERARTYSVRSSPSRGRISSCRRGTSRTARSRRTLTRRRGDGEATTYQATAYGNDYVGVVTTTSAGAAADKKFNLIVACTA